MPHCKEIYVVFVSCITYNHIFVIFLLERKNVTVSRTFLNEDPSGSGSSSVETQNCKLNGSVMYVLY
jgi:hypothetical protein